MEMYYYAINIRKKEMETNMSYIIGNSYNIPATFEMVATRERRSQ